MKKIFYFTCILFLLTGSLQAQIRRIATNSTDIGKIIPSFSEVSKIASKSISYTPPTSLISRSVDSASIRNRRYDYADVLPVNFNIADGNITSTSLGKVWTLKISVPNALNLSIVIDSLHLSDSAIMYIYNEDQNVLDSAIKQSNFRYSTHVGISPITGNSIILYVIEKGNFRSFKSNFSIHKVHAGFKKVDDVKETSSVQLFARDISCIPDIKCFPEHEFNSRSVCRFSTNGKSGTATLLNNESFNGKAYAITAFHVVDTDKDGVIDSNEELALFSSTFEFHVWQTTCNGGTVNSASTFSGAVLREQDLATDLVLLELSNPPGIGDGVNYAGWNRQSGSPSNSNSYLIHHPDGEDMRHSKTYMVRVFPFNSDYWEANYSDGVTIPGSSGCGLINENNQVVGVLSNGLTSCILTNAADHYGRLYTAWSNVNLYSWLSPSNNYNDIGGLNLTDIPIVGPGEINCSTAQTYYVRGGLDDGNYVWSVTPNLTIISGQNTSSITVLGNSAYNTDFYGTVTCTISTPNKGITRTLVLNKTLTFPTSTVVGYYSRAGYTNAFPLQLDADGTNDVYPGGTYATITSPNPTGASWSLIYGNPTSWNWNGSYGQLYIDMPNNEFAIWRMTVSTSCGTATMDFSFYATTGAAYRISPNPTSNLLQVKVIEKPVSSQQKSNTKAPKPKDVTIRQVRIEDKMGRLIKSHLFGNGLKQTNIDVSGLKADVYLIRIFDGNEWTTMQFIKQ